MGQIHGTISPGKAGPEQTFVFRGGRGLIGTFVANFAEINCRGTMVKFDFAFLDHRPDLGQDRFAQV